MNTAAEASSLALLAAAGFGLAMVVTKFGLRHLPPGSGALISIPSTALMFWCLAPFYLDTSGASLAASSVFAAVGLFFPAVVTLLIFESNHRMGPTVAGAISCTAPFFAIAGAVLWLGEQISVQLAVGTLGIVLGIIALSWEDKAIPREWPAWVVLLPLSAAAVRGLAQMAGKFGLNLWASPYAASLIGYSVSAVTVLIVAVARSGRTPVRVAWRGVPWFILAGLCNGGAVLAMYAALATGNVGIVSPIVAAYPLFTLLFSVLLWREERITWRLLLGVATTIAGVGLLVAG